MRGSKLKAMIWSCDTGQEIPCFDRCHSDHNMDVQYQRCMLYSANTLAVAAMWHDIIVITVHMHPEAVPLSLMTTRKASLMDSYEYGAPLSDPLGHWSSATMNETLHHWKYGQQ